MNIKTLLRRASLALALTMLALSLLSCGSSAPLHADLDFTAVDPTTVSETTQVTEYVKMTVAGYGDMIIRLYPEVAPKTVENFQKLVSEGFYDGLTFHRVIRDFVIQTGDPNGDGTGGSKQNIKGEFSANGFENNISHERGVISMARGEAYDSASCQFFIVHKDSPHLDGKYAAFGRVTDGLEVVDDICESARPLDNNGTIAETVQPVITSITIHANHA